MKKLITLALTAILILGCDDDKEKDSNRVSINLITTDDAIFFEKTLILFEDDNYLIKTNLDTYLNTYPYGEDEGDVEYEVYEEIKRQLIEDSNDTDILLMTDYFHRQSLSEYTLAHHLENGLCLIYDKHNNKIIKTVKMEGYSDGEPMALTLGRRFYIQGSLFLQIVDAIS